MFLNKKENAALRQDVFIGYLTLLHKGLRPLLFSVSLCFRALTLQRQLLQFSHSYMLISERYPVADFLWAVPNVFSCFPLWQVYSSFSGLYFIFFKNGISVAMSFLSWKIPMPVTLFTFYTYLYVVGRF